MALVLSRRIGEKIMVEDAKGNLVEITVIGHKNGVPRLSFQSAAQLTIGVLGGEEMTLKFARNPLVRIHLRKSDTPQHKISITAAAHISINRAEIYQRILLEREEAEGIPPCAA